MTDLAEKLRSALGSKLKDNSVYGKLPVYEDILLIKSEYPIRKQWEKLNLIKKNLLIVNRYIKYNKGESLNSFLKKERESGMSKLVLDKIGDKTDETGGVSAYFLNLQKLYDDEERKYDEMELKSKVDDVIDNTIRTSRESRIDKREIRGKIRKSEMKKLKDSGKGFFKQEEPKELSADTEVKFSDKEKSILVNKTKDAIKQLETPEEKIQRARKIIVSLAGVGIAIGLGTAIYSAFKNE